MAENTVKHCDGGVGSMVANHLDCNESSVVVTTLEKIKVKTGTKQKGKGNHVVGCH